MAIEFREYKVGGEWRVEDGEDGGAIIKGHAAVFDVLSDEIFGFREKVSRGAFARTLKEGADVRALFNHDANYVLGRTKSGTLSLSEDEVGLAISINAPKTQTIRDLVVEPIRRGDVDQMSFGFVVIEDAWDRKENIRTLLDVELFDVSPVTFPAYPATDVQVADIFGARKAAIEAEIARRVQINRNLARFYERALI